MSKKYAVIEYSGDYQIEQQPLWGQLFDAVEEADEAASKRYQEVAVQKTPDDQYYVLVQGADTETHEVLDEVVLGYTSAGRMEQPEIEAFCDAIANN